MPFVQLSDVVKKMQAWHNAAPTLEYPPAIAKRDCNGLLIFWDHYGRIDSLYGWRCESSENGNDVLNARASHWHGSANFNQFNDNSVADRMRLVG